MSHVYGVNATRAPLQQAVGKTAGAGAEIGDDIFTDVQTKCIKRVLELFAAATDKTRPGLEGHEISRFHRCTSARHLDSIDQDISGHDQRLGTRPALCQTSGNEILIEPRSHRSGSGSAI